MSPMVPSRYRVTLSVNNTARVNNLAPNFHRERPLTEPLLRLSAGFTDEGYASDPAVIYFDNSYSRDFEQDIDALKIINTDEHIPQSVCHGRPRTTINCRLAQ